MKTSWTAFMIVLALVFTGARPAAAGGLFGCCEESCDSMCDGDGSLLGGLEDSSCLGCIPKSDHCFDDFISPMINPVFFEDPRTLTEIRPIFMTHNLPTVAGSVLQGGSIQLYAAQIRVALTERLSLIAVKDGYVVANPGGAVLDSVLDDGWASVSAGLKYNLYRDVSSGTLLSTGFTYDIPIGSQRTLQDIADGEFHLFVSGGQSFCDGDAHVLSTFGWRQPVDSSAQTTSVHWSNHADVRLNKWLYGVTEFAWWHWTDDADGAGGAALGFAGQDLLNVFANDVAGNDLVTQGVGFRIKPSANLELGAIYEFPLTGFKDVIQDRWTFDMIVRY